MLNSFDTARLLLLDRYRTKLNVHGSADSGAWFASGQTYVRTFSALGVPLAYFSALSGAGISALISYA